MPWQFLLVLLVLTVPRVLDRLPGIVRAFTLRRLVKAVDEKADWTDGTVKHVLKLITELDRHLTSTDAEQLETREDAVTKRGQADGDG